MSASRFPDQRDRRTQQRAPIVVQVDFTGETASALGRSENISVGGVLIATPDTLPLGSEVTLRFVLPGPSRAVPMQLLGKVVRLEPGASMGIQFMDISPEQRTAVADYVRRSAESGV